VAGKVQDHMNEEFKEAQNQRGQIQDDLIDIRQVLENIRSMQRPERGKYPFPTTIEVEASTASSEKDTI
jgi:hypothetical protein